MACDCTVTREGGFGADGRDARDVINRCALHDAAPALATLLQRVVGTFDVGEDSADIIGDLDTIAREARALLLALAPDLQPERCTAMLISGASDPAHVCTKAIPHAGHHVDIFGVRWSGDHA